MKATRQVIVVWIFLVAMTPTSARGADAVLWSGNFDAGTEGQSILTPPLQWTSLSADRDDPGALADLFLHSGLHPGWTGLAIDGSSSLGGTCGGARHNRGSGFLRRDIGGLLPSHGIITLSAKIWADRLQTSSGLGLFDENGFAGLELIYNSEELNWYLFPNRSDGVTRSPKGIGVDQTVIGKLFTDLDNLEVWAQVVDDASGVPVWTSPRVPFDLLGLPLECVMVYVNRCEVWFGTEAGMDIDDIVVTGPSTTLAPSNLTCALEPVRKVGLGWTNAQAYDRLEVYRDGISAANLLDGNVTGQSFTDTAVPVGAHEYRVRGIIGDEWSPMADPCTVTVPLETDFFLHIDNISGKKGAEAEATVHLDFDHVTADPTLGDIQAWSYGICNDVNIVEPLDITIEGTDTGGLHGGAGPDFSSFHVYPEGVTVAVIVDQDEGGTIPAVNDWSDVKIRYKLLGTGLNCAGNPEPLSGKLQVCNTLGSPPVLSVATVNLASLPSSGSDGGNVQVSCSNQYFIRLEPVAGTADDMGRLNVRIDFNHDGTNAGQVQGWSYGLCHDPAVLSAIPPKHTADIWGTGLVGLNGGTGPGFLKFSIYEGGVTVAVVVDMQNVVTIPPENGWHDTIITYSLVDRNGECTKHPGAVLTTQIQPCRNLGSPPVSNVMTVDLKSIPLGGYEAAVLGIRCGTLFLRADASVSQVVDITDGIFILSHLFIGTQSTCRDALDTNDDGEVDISDGIYVLSYLFLGGPAPPAPFEAVGRDTTPDSLDCQEYEPQP